MTWINLLRDLGIFSIVAYVLQRIIDNSSNRKLEKYKQELDFTIRSYQLTLDTDLQRHKSELDLHLSRQTSLHEKRLLIIDEMFKKLITLDSAMRDMIGIHLVIEDGEKEQNERVTRAQQAFSDYNNYYLFHSLYFNKATSELLENVRKEYFSANWDFFELKRLNSFTGGRTSKEGVQHAYEKIESSSKRIREDIPKVIENVQEEFRKLLGVT